ncbi:MAG: septal ring lytic transglycosylase RlpA family protein [Saprospiraceae bacterium]|nr:septal ring lytic transglycosylase RlpA family protein [Saprospiraceae bacterium]
MKNYLWLILICMSFVANAQSNTGNASFIGDRFHGLKMASGETYDKTTMVAGHRTLPYGTQVKITNNNSGNAVIVTIKDRGPFVKGEIIEVSRAAGEALGMVYDEKTSVRIEVVGAGSTTVATTEETPNARSTTTVENTAKGRDEVKEYNTTTSKPAAKVETTATAKSPAKPKPAKKTWSSSTGVYKADIMNQPKTGYGVQIGVFSDMNAVIERIAQLKGTGFSDVFFTVDSNGGKTTHKIIIGNYSNQDQATAYKKLCVLNIN